MFQIARLVGATLREAIAVSLLTGQTSEDQFGASIILGSQIKGSERTFPAGALYSTKGSKLGQN